MVGIGLVGIGFMGMIHYLAAGRVATDRARVVALCSRDPRKLAGDWSNIQGNFGPRGTQVDLAHCRRYSDYDSLLADPDVTLVDLCVPNDQHAALAIRALDAGKHVLVEKPIALSLTDADSMLQAAHRNGRLLMVAHVLPFFPEFHVALDAVRSGRHGRLLAGQFMRIISKPNWSAAIADHAASGGPALDLHIHDTHFVSLLHGTPHSVRSQGVVHEGAVLHIATQYRYGDDTSAPTLSAVAGSLSQPGRSFAHGYELYFERATITLGNAHRSDQGWLTTLSVLHDDGRVEHPLAKPADPIDAFAAELAHAVEGVVHSRIPHELSAQVARNALATCRAEIQSALSGEEVVLI